MAGFASMLKGMRFLKLTCVATSVGILAFGLGLTGTALASARRTKATLHARRATAVNPHGHATRARRSSHSSKRYKPSSIHVRRHRSRSRHHRIIGQRQMDAQRATQIQQALIQAHYLNGAPTGQWDAATQAAMMKYQADNGWQSKIAPDSRALIKLGLGPKQDAGEYSTNLPGASQGAIISRPATANPTSTVGNLADSTMPSSATDQN